MPEAEIAEAIPSPLLALALKANREDPPMTKSPLEQIPPDADAFGPQTARSAIDRIEILCAAIRSADDADAFGPQTARSAVDRIEILCAAIRSADDADRRAAFVTIGELALAAITRINRAG